MGWYVWGDVFPVGGEIGGGGVGGGVCGVRGHIHVVELV